MGNMADLPRILHIGSLWLLFGVMECQTEWMDVFATMVECHTAKGNFVGNALLQCND
jgi:hypothetical protein